MAGKDPIIVDLHTPNIIGDPVHGYIPLTDLEYNILQLPIMTRLHHLRQTQTAYLTFPGSVSTRFSHVVGALYIGHKIIMQLLSTIDRPTFKILFPKVKSAEFVVRTVRLACLFHDVGHGPFSHAGEEAMLKVMKKYDKKRVREAEDLFEKSIDEVPIHEYYSYKLVTNKEIRKQLLSEKDGMELIESVSTLLVKSSSLRLMKMNPNGYKLLRKIVSSQMDADRMDYLLRDSMMSGVKFGQVDINRIIRNMALIRDWKGEYEIAFHERAIGNIEDMLDARFKMYRWFYNHHTVMVTNELMKLAIDMLIEKNDSIAKLFHWSTYDSGFSTDDYILSKIRENVNDQRKPQYKKVKGILDRRYFPVSLFKSNPDTGRMIKQIKNIMHKNTSDELILKRINSFFRGDGERILKAKLETIKHLSNCLVFQTKLQLKPYKYFSVDEDLIFLYRPEKNYDVCELSEESRYFKAINEQWTKYPTLYVFYLIPDKKKTTIKKHKEKINDILAYEIANFT